MPRYCMVWEPGADLIRDDFPENLFVANLQSVTTQYTLVTTDRRLHNGDYKLVTTHWWLHSGHYTLVTTHWWLHTGDYTHTHHCPLYTLNKWNELNFARKTICDFTRWCIVYKIVTQTCCHTDQSLVRKWIQRKRNIWRRCTRCCLPRL